MLQLMPDVSIHLPEYSVDVWGVWPVLATGLKERTHCVSWLDVVKGD